MKWSVILANAKNYVSYNYYDPDFIIYLSINSMPFNNNVCNHSYERLVLFSLIGFKSCFFERELRRTTYIITTAHAQCATSIHVQRNWWYQQGMTVPLVGPRSTMGTWWQGTLATSIQPLSFALIGRQSLFMAVTIARMVPFCTSSKDSVVHCYASRTLLAENWLALCAPNEPKQAKEITFEKELQTLLFVF